MAENEIPDEEAVAVTGRPNDTPISDPQPAPLGGNSTFAERAKAAKKVAAKAVDADSADAENKSVTSAATKTTKAAKKK